MAGFIVFLLLPFLFLLFLVLFSDEKCIGNYNYPGVLVRKSLFFSGKSFQQEQNFAHILMSFGEIIRLTAANFLVFFALP